MVSEQKKGRILWRVYDIILQAAGKGKTSNQTSPTDDRCVSQMEDSEDGKE